MDDSAQNRPHSRMPLVPRGKNCQPADGIELLNIDNIAGEFSQKQTALFFDWTGSKTDIHHQSLTFKTLPRMCQVCDLRVHHFTSSEIHALMRSSNDSHIINKRICPLKSGQATPNS